MGEPYSPGRRNGTLVRLTGLWTRGVNPMMRPAGPSRWCVGAAVVAGALAAGSSGKATGGTSSPWAKGGCGAGSHPAGLLPGISRQPTRSGAAQGAQRRDARQGESRPHRHVDRHQRALLPELLQRLPAPGQWPLPAGQRRTEAAGASGRHRLAARGAFRPAHRPPRQFDRPELSPCLARFSDKDDPNYAEALAIIRVGQERLRRRPRADMPGFVPCQTDRRRQTKYAMRRRIEADNRRAIRDGTKRYDDRPAAETGNAGGE